MSPTSLGVLVTGASRGIGRAIALAFAEAGDRVAVHYGRSREAAEAVVAELPGDGYGLVRADIADADAVRAGVDSAAEQLGRLDVGHEPDRGRERVVLRDIAPGPGRRRDRERCEP